MVADAGRLILTLLMLSSAGAVAFVAASIVGTAVSHRWDLPTRANSLSEWAAIREAMSTWLLLPLAAYAFAITTNVGTAKLEDPETFEQGRTFLLWGVVGVEVVGVIAMVVYRRHARRARLAGDVHVLRSTIQESPAEWRGSAAAQEVARQFAHMEVKQRRQRDEGRLALRLIGGRTPDWRRNPPLGLGRLVGTDGRIVRLTAADRWAWIRRRSGPAALLLVPVVGALVFAVGAALDTDESASTRAAWATGMVGAAAGYVALTMLLARLEIGLAVRRQLEADEVKTDIRRMVAAAGPGSRSARPVRTHHGLVRVAGRRPVLRVPPTRGR